MLPSRYYVTHGHLIDMNGNVSSQLDVIIADNFGVPALMRTKDGTEYIPIESVYAIGEIKSTYYKTQQPVEKFCDDIKDIRENLYHELIPNTLYDGIQNDTDMRDVFLGKRSRMLNYIYKFMLFIDSGDFKFIDIAKYFHEHDNKYLPNLTVMLSSGVIVYGELTEKGFTPYRYPDLEPCTDLDWYFEPIPGRDGDSMEGSHLAALYWSLLEHLADSHLDPPMLGKYMSRLLTGRKSLLVKARSVV